ncbi:cysteine dioxygenase family protein [Myxococcaceae bacterium GXIMD 01537]
MDSVGLQEVVRHLREGGPETWGELAGVRLAPGTLRPYLHFRRRRYTRNLVYRDARVEVLVLCWDGGVASPIHEHGGQRCWLGVHAGVLLLEDFPLLSGGLVPGPARLGRPSGPGPVGAGHVDFRGPADSVHRVRALRGPAVTLHVYAAPVDACLVYDTRRHRCEERRLAYDSVFGRVGAPWPPTTASRAEGPRARRPHGG